MDDKFINKKGLRERGWTDSLFERFYPTPDKTRGNRFNRAAPLCYYSLQQVKSIESTPEFQAAKEHVSLLAQKAKATAKRKTAERVESTTNLLRLQVKPSTSLEEVRAEAIEAYNQRQLFKGKPPASLNSAPDFLDRMTVNYLRHECSNYEEVLANLKGRVGGPRAYEVARRTLHAAIDDLFPELGAYRFDVEDDDIPR